MDDLATEKQLKLIQRMEEFSEYPLPHFTGNTKTEAAQYILKYYKLAHESVWAIENGYN